MQTTRLIIIRYGETEWNLEGRIQGHLDSPLTETGRAQAGAIAGRLCEVDVNALYSSDLGRAYATAQIVSDKTGLETITDIRLRELNLGKFEGLTEEEVRKRFPEEYRYLKDSDPDYIYPDGESKSQFSLRVISCLEELMGKHLGDQIVVITHGGALSRLIRYTLGMPVVGSNEYKVCNAALNVFSYQNKRWQLEIWGDISHLTEVTITSA
jgi:probable phosphoglycerate mutase